MLSPGTHHLRVPGTLAENLAAREKLLRLSVEYPEVARQLRRMCGEDLLFFVNLFGFSFDPRKAKRRVAPFITYDFQVRALRQMLDCVGRPRRLVVEKSRDMGATYLMAFVMVWLCAFRPNVNCLVISHNEDAVDDSDNPNCVFWKVDRILEAVPRWLIPFDPGANRSSLKFHFPETRSYINGTASTSRAGVSGRATLIFVDEFAQIREGRAMRVRTASTADTRFFVSTHLGTDTEFYRMCQEPDAEKVRMHWTEHPEKARGLYEYDPLRPSVPIVHDKEHRFPPDYSFVLDGSPTGGPRPGVRSPWYDEKCREIGNAPGVAQDLDMNPSGSVSQFYDSVVVRGLLEKLTRPADWIGRLDYDAERGEPAERDALVKDPAGGLALWIFPRIDGSVPRAYYTVGCDVAAGVGKTPSTCCVYRAMPGKRAVKVAQYADRFITPDNFARLATSLCRHFKGPTGEGARLGWESAGPTGALFWQTVRDLGYRNVYVNRREDRMYKKGLTPSGESKPGWYPSPASRLYLHGMYREALASGAVTNYSEDALRETMSYQYKPGAKDVFHPGCTNAFDASTAGDNHGDLVIADAIAWMLRGELDDDLGVEEFGAEDAPADSTMAGRFQLAYDAKRRKQSAWVE